MHPTPKESWTKKKSVSTTTSWESWRRTCRTPPRPTGTSSATALIKLISRWVMMPFRFQSLKSTKSATKTEKRIRHGRRIITVRRSANLALSLAQGVTMWPPVVTRRPQAEARTMEIKTIISSTTMSLWILLNSSTSSMEKKMACRISEQCRIWEMVTLFGFSPGLSQPATHRWSRSRPPARIVTLISNLIAQTAIRVLQAAKRFPSNTILGSNSFLRSSSMRQGRPMPRANT